MLTVEEVRARGIKLPVDEDAAYSVLDEIAAWLASRIGPLDGERTETFLSAPPLQTLEWDQRRATLRLQRPTDSIALTDNGIVVVDHTLRGSFVLSATGYWNGPVVATYTPNDEMLVRGVLFGLLRIESTETGFESETMGSYSYTRSGPATGGGNLSRWALLRRLLPRQSFDSVPVRSGFDRPFPASVVTADYVTP